MAAVEREIKKEHLKNGQLRNISVPRINQEYITQVFEEIKGKVSKKLSQDFSKTESRILVALSRLDEFVLDPQVRTHFETVPGISRNTDVEDQEPTGDRSQNVPHPEVGSSVYQSHHSFDSDPDEGLRTSIRINFSTTDQIKQVLLVFKRVKKLLHLLKTIRTRRYCSYRPLNSHKILPNVDQLQPN